MRTTGCTKVWSRSASRVAPLRRGINMGGKWPTHPASSASDSRISPLVGVKQIVSSGSSRFTITNQGLYTDSESKCWSWQIRPKNRQNYLGVAIFLFFSGFWSATDPTPKSSHLPIKWTLSERKSLPWLLPWSVLPSLAFNTTDTNSFPIFKLGGPEVIYTRRGALCVCVKK